MISFDDNDDDDDDPMDIDSPSLPVAKRMRMPPSPLRAPSGTPRAASDGGSGSIAPGEGVQVETLIFQITTNVAIFKRLVGRLLSTTTQTKNHSA